MSGETNIDIPMTETDSESEAFWDQVRANAPEEPTSENLPEGWYIGTTCTAENGNWGPRVRVLEANGDKPESRIFNIGIKVTGAEAKNAKARLRGRYAGFEAWIKPGSMETDNKGPISGKLTGFLNACFAPGVGADLKGKARTSARWLETSGLLRTTAQEKGLSLARYEGDLSRYLTGLANARLSDESRTVLFKIAHKKGNDDVVRARVNAVEDATEALIKKHGIALFEETSEPTGMDY